MPKNRMTAVDVRASVSTMRSRVENLRVANIYDISGKLYVIKFARGEAKHFVLIEAGIRCHITDWKRDKDALPSHFTMRLRKYLRTMRLETLRQLGADRVVDFQFGAGENARHLLVELYVSGNVVLTDSNFTILSILRRARLGAEVLMAVKEKYPIEQMSGIHTVCRSPVLLSNLNSQNLTSDPDVILEVLLILRSIKVEESKKKSTMMEGLGQVLPYCHRELLASSLIKAGLSKATMPNLSLSNSSELTEQAKIIVTGAQFALQQLREVSWPGDVGGPPAMESPSCPDIRGCIQLVRDTKNPEVLIFNNFCPVVGLVERPSDPELIEEFLEFGMSMDAYFSKVEVQKADRQKAADELAGISRVAKIKSDQMRRVEELEAEIASLELSADLVNENSEFVQKAINLVRDAVATGVDWVTLWNHIRAERRNGHPIASNIKQLKLEANQFILLLSQWREDDDLVEEYGAAELVPIQIDFTLSVLGNVESLHQRRKAAMIKAGKTAEAADRAIAEAEKKLFKEIQRKDRTAFGNQIIQKIRKPFWFEKFHWFLSSEGYLILGGQDATQNDVLYKKYLEKNDLYIHADVHGAASCILKNPAGGEVPERTLVEAGHFSVCHSAAWAQKSVTPAWWVYSHQVSKTAPTGEYLTRGGFMIRGKKNFIQTSRLEMGLVFLFLVDEGDVPRHAGERSKKFEDVGTPPMARQESVRFSDVTIAPTPSIHQVVSFDELPPSIVSIERATDEHRTPCRRSDSVDEGAPPEGGNAGARELLDKSSTKSSSYEGAEDRLSSDECILNVVTSSRSLEEEKLRMRQGSIDGGPVPPGFGPGDLPTAKDILRPTCEPDDNPILAAIFGSIQPTKPRSQKSVKEEKLAKTEESVCPKKQTDLKRRTRNKLRKMQKKYGEQSDGEREEKLMLLGAITMKHMRPVASDEPKAAEDRRAERLQEAKPLISKREVKEVKALLEMEDEGFGAALDPEMSSKMSALARFTGIPDPEKDTIVGCVPMCAPYSAVPPTLYRYRAKLIPGTGRKGKAAEKLISLFICQSRVESEKQMIKSLQLPVLTQCLIGDVKISAPGIVDMEKKEKMAKRNAKKKLQETKDT